MLIISLSTTFVKCSLSSIYRDVPGYNNVYVTFTYISWEHGDNYIWHVHDGVWLHEISMYSWCKYMLV